jgi:hypothetical protein
MAKRRQEARTEIGRELAEEATAKALAEMWNPNWIRIPIAELRVGDHIVTKYNERTGRSTKSTTVTSIKPPATKADGGGCKGFHVNTSQCWSHISRVPVMV